MIKLLEIKLKSYILGLICKILVKIQIIGFNCCLEYINTLRNATIDK